MNDDCRTGFVTLTILACLCAVAIAGAALGAAAAYHFGGVC